MPNAGAHDTEEQSAELAVEDLIRRAGVLLDELHRFKDFLGQNHQDVEMGKFRSNIESELRPLRRLESASTSNPSIHALRSSNLPFYEAVWAAAKRSSGLVTFLKRFQMPDASKKRKGESTASRRRRGESTALVDIITNDGLEWIKVSTVTQTRLLFEIAKQGWERNISDSDENEDDNDDRSTPDGEREISREQAEADEDGIAILRMAEEITQAARVARTRYRHPKVRMVLPRINLHEVEEIDQVIDDIRRLGVIVETAADLTGPNANPDLNTVLPRLLVDKFSSLSDTLNVDCTILLAIVSDISHGKVPEQDWYHKATRRQIEVEETEPMLSKYIYPASVGREMVCTADAARRMQEIVDTIATDTERARTALLLTREASVSVEERRKCREAMQKLSEHPVPDNWMIPIRIVQYDESVRSKLPQGLANHIAAALSPLNQSIFFYGWANNLTTISCHKSVTKEIENLVREYDGDEGVLTGPEIWLSNVTRSLIGKDKHRRD